MHESEPRRLMPRLTLLQAPAKCATDSATQGCDSIPPLLLFLRWQNGVRPCPSPLAFGKDTAVAFVGLAQPVIDTAAGVVVDTCPLLLLMPDVPHGDAAVAVVDVGPATDALDRCAVESSLLETCDEPELLVARKFGVAGGSSLVVVVCVWCVVR
ncbi:hypothetical protein J3F82_006472 [Coemansia sp. RSA 637]|nr:hypothetical protein J3F82_006472 [Coemansia sp. RSA 637]